MRCGRRNFTRMKMRERLGREARDYREEARKEGGPLCRHCPHPAVLHTVTPEQRAALPLPCAGGRVRQPCRCPGYEAQP